MSRRGWMIVAWVSSLVAVAAVTVAVLSFTALESVRSAAQEIDRPARESSSPRPKPLDLTEQERLPDRPPPDPRQAPTPEVQRRTPVALTAEPFSSASQPETELGERPPATGEPEAFGLFQASVVDKGSAIWIAEPVVASKGDRRMVVWNYGAAFSSDGGKTFTYVDPRRPEFPQDKGPYCCDQIALYDPARDLWFWFIQYYVPPGGRANIIRIAFAKGDQAFDARSFQYYDFTAANFPLLGSADMDLDYPNMAMTSENLFLAINAYANDRYQNTVVLRIPLDEIGGSINWRYFVSPLGSGDFAEGASDTMYFAQHVDTATLRVFAWADGQDDTTSTDVVHSDYPYEGVSGPDFTCVRTGSNAPSGAGDWCARLREGRVTNDDRIASGWATGDTIGFTWNVPRSARRGFLYPFAYVVRIDRSSMRVVDEPALWSSKHAYQYVTVEPNARGDLGAIALGGGGDRFQSCVGLIRDAGGSAWEARILDESDADPDQSQAGDYLGIVPSRPGANRWTASCMTLHGGGAAQNVEIRTFDFGRHKDNR